MVDQQLLVDGAAKLGLSLDTACLQRFALYQHMLLEWNERFNLTAARTPQEIQLRHFVDSLSCSLVTGDLTDQVLVDVGTGAGFPGLPLKLLYPGLRLTLIESVKKKARFLEAVISELELADVLVLPRRAEEVAHEPAHREQYDWAVARAVAHLSPLMEYMLPLCRKGGFALAQKGTRVADELDQSKRAISLLGGELLTVNAVALEKGDEAHLVVVAKIEPTPAPYPRRAGIPVKRPL